MDLDLGLSTHELELRDRARVFATEIARPRAAATDRDEQYPWDIVKALPPMKRTRTRADAEEFLRNIVTPGVRPPA